MIDQINKLIAINLFLLFTSDRDSLSLKDFKNEQGNQLPGAKMLAEIMEQKELLKLHSEEEFSYQLTELGRQIAESGGWLTHLEKSKKVKKSANYEFKKVKSKNKKIHSELVIASIIMLALCIMIVSCI